MPPVQIAAGDDTTYAMGLLFYNAAINATNTCQGNHVPLGGDLTKSIMIPTLALMLCNMNINIRNWSHLLCGV